MFGEYYLIRYLKAIGKVGAIRYAHSLCSWEEIMLNCVRFFLAKLGLSWVRSKGGSGIFSGTWDLSEFRPSRHPNSTLNEGPLAWNQTQQEILVLAWKLKCILVSENLTRTTASLAAIANLSAHETMPGHAASTAWFLLIIMSKQNGGSQRFSWASLSASFRLIIIEV